GGEIALLPAGGRVDVRHPVDELLERPLALRCADGAAEILCGDDVGGVDRPEVGELDPVLLEVDRAVPPVGHHDVAALPGDLVVGVPTRRRVDAPDLQAPAAPALGRRRTTRRPPQNFLFPFSAIPTGPTLSVGASAFYASAWAFGRYVVVLVVVVPAAQCGDFLLEVIQRLEAPVDRGEPEVRDLVEVAERPEDRQAHLVRRHLRQATCPDRLLHSLGEHRELVFVDRPALAGALHTPDNLVPGERLGHAASLGHHQDDRLLPGEPPSA